jgi:hypothetical protein
MRRLISRILALKSISTAQERRSAFSNALRVEDKAMERRVADVHGMPRLDMGAETNLAAELQQVAVAPTR